MRRLFVILCACALLLSFGCKKQTVSSAVDYCCDTVVTLRAYAPQETVDEAMRLIRDYERVLSKTAEGSDIDRLNRAEGQPAHP